MTVETLAADVGRRGLAAAQAAPTAHGPTVDMDDLAKLVRALLNTEVRRRVCMRLGRPGGFDVVISAGGAGGVIAMEEMDVQQYPAGCGPVIADPRSATLYWLVPPGSAERWEPHAYAVCLGAPHRLTLPLPGAEGPGTARTPPRPYWQRPFTSDQRVPVGPLRDVLTRLRPQPTPHQDLADYLAARTTVAACFPAVATR